VRDRYWQDQVAVVTGASSGIGRAVAGLLLNDGARVGLIGRSVERLTQAAEPGPGRALILPVDVRDRQAIRDAINRVVDQWSRIDLLAYCAGQSTFALAEDVGEHAREILETNLLGALWATQAVLPTMRQAARGRIVFVGSINAHVAPAGFAAYAMSKWGLSALAQSLRAEIRGSGIHVSLVSPGYVRTPLLDAELAGGPLPAYDPRTVLAPDDVARAILVAATTNRREIILAPWWLKLGLLLGKLLPELQEIVLARAARPMLETRRARAVGGGSAPATDAGPRKPTANA
jgi:NADP-dependent 3-hydroxy acid dehydrogenase YdfG